MKKLEEILFGRAAEKATKAIVILAAAYVVTILIVAICG